MVRTHILYMDSTPFYYIDPRSKKYFCYKHYSLLYLAQKYGPYGPGITTPDMEDVKESVKQGVSKVAGRLSGMASGVMTQLQVTTIKSH